MAVVRQIQQRLDGIEFGRVPQIRMLADPKPPDRLRQTSRQMLQAQRIGIAGGLEGSPCDFVTPRPRRLVARQVIQNHRQVGEHPNHRRSGKTPRQVAVLTMRRASFRQMKLPVGGRRNWLKLQCPRGGIHHGQGPLGSVIGLSLVAAAQARQPILRKLFDGDAQSLNAFVDMSTPGLLQCRSRKLNTLGCP